MIFHKKTKYAKIAKNVFEKVAKKKKKKRFILPAIKIKDCCIPESSSQHLFLQNPPWHSNDQSITQPYFEEMSKFNLNTVFYPDKETRKESIFKLFKPTYCGQFLWSVMVMFSKVTANTELFNTEPLLLEETQD